MRKSKFDIILAIEMYNNGLKYKEIAVALNSSPDAIRMAIKKYAPDQLDIKKKEVIELFKVGMTYKEIAEKVHSTEDAIRMFLKKYIPEELRKRRAEKTAQKINKHLFEPKEEELNLKVIGALSVEDRKQLLDEKRWGINQNESISDYAFFKVNRQSYISDKKNNRKYIFDEKRGSIQEDLETLYL